MEEEKPSKESESKPTPRGLPRLDRLDELMKGVDLWEIDKSEKLSQRVERIAVLG